MKKRFAILILIGLIISAPLTANAACCQGLRSVHAISTSCNARIGCSYANGGGTIGGYHPVKVRSFAQMGADSGTSDAGYYWAYSSKSTIPQWGTKTRASIYCPTTNYSAEANYKWYN